MKRFWDSATYRKDNQGHAVLLDGRPVHLPGGGVLLVEAETLAQAMAAEWQAAGGAKGGVMSFEYTPLTRLSGTALERIAPNPDPTIDAIARYGESDLLCYRADYPPRLVERQAREWQPWLDWAAETYRAPLRVATGVGHVRQHRDSITALRRTVAALDIYALAALGLAVPATGSLVLGLALAAGALDAAAAHALGTLDEQFQLEEWGTDAEAEARLAGIAADIALAERLLRLTRPT